MNILVTGAAGQLGQACCRALADRGHRVMPTDHPAQAGVGLIPLDITDSDAVMDTVRRLRPDKILHCAAWTDVDAAERKENVPKVWAVNADGTRNLALAARNVGAALLYISTDYVFGDSATRPHRPEDRDFCPLNVYGQAKLAGEEHVRSLLKHHYIVRTSWVFGPGGKSFVRTMLRLGNTSDSVRVIDDQVGTPTYAPDLARLLTDLLETDRWGVYHATNEGGYVSWCDFAREIFRQSGSSTCVIPVSTAEYGLSAARRPLNSRLDKACLPANGFMPLPDWRDALGRYLRENMNLQGLE
ncbi:MAG: dTDP-4-dehydrorhamnose reductase [Clostridia bacterium]|nr:dTDP-4-dehydrorhamnose reductase [Clostridia bacterium]